jgi:hypothetical protein
MADVLCRLLDHSNDYHVPCCGRFRKRFVFWNENNTQVCCDQCGDANKPSYQIYKYTYQLAMKYDDVKHFLPYHTDVMSYVSNGARVTLLRPSMRMAGQHQCLSCSNVVQRRNCYCSVLCLYDDLLITHEHTDEHTPSLFRKHVQQQTITVAPPPPTPTGRKRVSRAAVVRRTRDRKNASPTPSPSL